jgi:hypothetical protein
MGKKRLPDLPDTGRRYVDQTVRARLASPGIEHYAPRKGRGAWFAVVLLLAVALLAAMYFLS